MSEPIPELNDVQIALIVKRALDYNASVLQYASFIYGQDAKPHIKKRWVQDLRKMGKEYSEDIQKIVMGEIKK